VFTQSTRHSCHILRKLEFSRQIFKKSSNIEFQEHVFIGSQVVLRERTDRQSDKANSRFLQFLQYLYVFQNTPYLLSYSTLTVINDRGGELLLLGTKRVFKERGLRFVVKRLNYFCKVSHVTGSKTCCLTFHHLLHICAISFFHCLVLTFRELSPPTQVVNLSG